MNFTLTSPAFKNGEYIPKKHTGEGIDVSPKLVWENPPEGVKSFALICDDPDAPAGVWVHWVVYNIPPTMNSLAENMPKTVVMPNGIRQGVTDFGNVGYGGPMPPPGKPHRYFFKLYALDTILDFDPTENVTKQSLIKKMQDHILAEAELMGLYKR